MSASCAICLAPIPTGTKFVITGSEVVHPACARSGRVTQVWLLRRELARAVEQSERSATTAARAVETTTRATAEAVQLRADLAEMRRTLKRTATEGKRARDQVLKEQALREADRQAHADELEELRRSSGLPAPRPSPQSTTMRDDTEIRFSLLELDEKE